MILVNIKHKDGFVAIDPFSVLAVWMKKDYVIIQTKFKLEYCVCPPEDEDLKEFYDDICRDIHWSNEK